MNLRTYQALSLTEALTRIKADLGEDAVVLHSRTFRRGGMLGLGGQLIYEVTASPPAPRAEVKPQSLQRAAAMRRRDLDRTVADDSARTAAMALALAEQARRRQQSATPPLPADAPSPAPPVTRFSRPGIEVELSRPLVDAADAPAAPQLPRPAPPVRRQVAPALPADQKTPGRPRQEPAPLPVARRYVLSPDAPVASPPSSSAPPPQRQLPRSNGKAPVTKAARSAEPLHSGRAETALHDELTTLKQMVGQVLQRQSGTLQPAMPEALFNEYVSLIQNEVAQEIADELCDVVRRELSEADLKNPRAVRDAFRRHLAQYVPVAPDSLLVESHDGRPLTIALVGPTGVGKTTTVAKLAAAFKLRHGKRVGLITTDTYRIAAVDQLRTYANIIGLPLKVALTPDEMAEACESLANCDVILIDTAGRSPNDGARLDEIRAFATAADPHEIHLVLSSTCSEPALMRTIERFSTVKTDRVIFTKTDEAVSLGVLINVMRKAGKELSFITTGQEVPDHIEAGSPERLAALVLGEKG
ncbi:MAG: flagellar biosynthesis protein FlhF [Phycisphaerales bacterium]|nr:flagellar biosynthesis protein FlhF [Phycisphaerales bacterium]